MSESYPHNYAINLLCQKLQQAEKSAKHEYCNYGPFQWRHNYGVHKELAFYDGSSPYYFEMSEPSTKKLFTIDLTIFHKGIPLYLIEVVHTHKTPESKIKLIAEFFEGHDVHLHEIQALDIARHNFDVLKTKVLLG